MFPLFPLFSFVSVVINVVVLVVDVFTIFIASQFGKAIMFQAQQAAARSRRRTSLGRKFKATAEAISTSRALGDISNLLDEAISSCRVSTKGAASFNLIKKALPHVQSHVTQNVVKACPKGGASVKYAVSCIEKEAKKRKSIEAQQQHPSQRRKSDSFLAVKAFVDTTENVNDKCSASPDTAPPTLSARSLPITRLSFAPFPADDKTPAFPKPYNGVTYSPAEVVSILAKFKNGANALKMQTAVKKRMVEKRLVGPVTVNGLNRVLSNIAKSGGVSIPDSWSNRGRPGLVSLDELRLIAVKMRTKKGGTVNMETFTSMVTAFLRDKHEGEGKATLGIDLTPCTRTLRNMMALLCVMNEQEALDFVPLPKTNTRFTAENSLMSAMAFAATVAGTHFIPGLGLPSIEVSEGAARMLALVDEAYHDDDVPSLGSRVTVGDPSTPGPATLGPVRPQYIYSTDDTTQYIFKGPTKTGALIGCFAILKILNTRGRSACTRSQKCRI